MTVILVFTVRWVLGGLIRLKEARRFSLDGLIDESTIRPQTKTDHPLHLYNNAQRRTPKRLLEMLGRREREAFPT